MALAVNIDITPAEYYNQEGLGEQGRIIDLTDAASQSADLDADPKLCISCMRCVARCPQSDRKVNGAIAAAALAMKKVCSVRKNNELYL